MAPQPTNSQANSLVAIRCITEMERENDRLSTGYNRMYDHFEAKLAEAEQAVVRAENDLAVVTRDLVAVGEERDKAFRLLQTIADETQVEWVARHITDLIEDSDWHTSSDAT